MTEPFLADDMKMRVWILAANDEAASKFFRDLLNPDLDVVDWKIDKPESLVGSVHGQTYVTVLRAVVKREAVTTEPYWLQRVMFNSPGIVRFRMVSVEEVNVASDYRVCSFEFEKTNRGPNREDVYIDEETVNIPTVAPPGPPPQDEDPPLPKLVPDLSGPAMSDRLQHHLIHHAGFPPIVALGVMVELFAEAMTKALDEFEQETGHRGMITVVAKEGEIQERDGKLYLFVQGRAVQPAVWVQPHIRVWLILSSPDADGLPLMIGVLQSEPKGVELLKRR